MKKTKAFTLIELLIVVAIIAILAAIAVPNFLEAQIRSKVSRARADMRTMATALESYYVDNNQYPAWAAYGSTIGANLTVSVDYGKIPTTVTEYDMRSWAVNPDPATDYMWTLSTPLGYITSYPGDSFSPLPGGTFGYYTDPTQIGWVIYSPGPDSDGGSSGGGSDLNNDVESVYNPFITQPSLTLNVGDSSNDGAFTYDPTNGTSSQGDLWRVKQ